MRQLGVVTIAQYLTAQHTKQSDFDATKFVKAVKGYEVRGHAVVPVCGRLEHLSEKNAHQALAWAAEMSSGALHKLGLTGPVALVPIPSSATTIALPRVRGRSHALAEALSFRNPHSFSVLDILSFRSEMVPSHKGGTRDVDLLRDAMIALPQRAHSVDPDVLLVDDILTTGGHFVAAWLTLHDLGWKVAGGFAVGRSQSYPEEDPFAVKIAYYLDGAPEDDWHHRAGTCLVCGSPAIIENTFCPKCDSTIDLWIWEEPYSVVNGVARFEDETPECPECGHSPLEFEYSAFCSAHANQADRHD